MAEDWSDLLKVQEEGDCLHETLSHSVNLLMVVYWEGDDATPELRKAREQCFELADNCGPDRQLARARVSVLCDLRGQGWEFRLDGTSLLARKPKTNDRDPMKEKARVRAGLLLERDLQLQSHATQQFVKYMERKRIGPNGWTSIFSLMRDGSALATSLQRAARIPHGRARDLELQNIIDPYFQVVDNSKCEFTSLKLKEIWRYFRHTWVNSFKTVPGRNIWFLIRDRAAENHPVIGIAGLGSSVVQLGVRDSWIGWDRKSVFEDIMQNPGSVWALWIERSLEKLIGEIYILDFLQQGIMSEDDLEEPSHALVQRLEDESKRAKHAHRLYPKAAEHKRQKIDTYNWEEIAKAHLFRSKRASTLAQLLKAKIALRKNNFRTSQPETLNNVLSNQVGRNAVAGILRRIKASHVGIDMMDITVCGAVAPYNSILGGKLVSLLMASPEVIRAYHAKYANTPSIIASSMAGRPVIREPQLVFLGTTSLYAVGASQYNRLKLPIAEVGRSTDQEIQYLKLGKTAGYGSYQFSKVTLEEMEVMLAQNNNSRRVHSIFGEGVNPRLRKVREALDMAGFESDVLLKHGNQRIVYAVVLASNIRRILLGFDHSANYFLGLENAKEMTERIAGFWTHRWLSRRIENDRVLEEVAQHRLTYPIRHGARVPMPTREEQLGLFEDI